MTDERRVYSRAELVEIGKSRSSLEWAELFRSSCKTQWSKSGSAQGGQANAGRGGGINVLKELARKKPAPRNPAAQNGNFKKATDSAVQHREATMNPTDGAQPRELSPADKAAYATYFRLISEGIAGLKI